MTPDGRFLERIKVEVALKKLNERYEKMEEKMFRDREHWNAFTHIISRMNNSDCYHISVAYLLTLDEITRRHFNDLFSVQEDCIKRDGLHAEWQTSTTMKVTRLAFNLWNGCCDDGAEYTDNEGYKVPLPSAMYSVGEVFSCSYAPYFYEAIKLRYPEYVSD